MDEVVQSIAKEESEDQEIAEKIADGVESNDDGGFEIAKEESEEKSEEEGFYFENPHFADQNAVAAQQKSKVKVYEPAKEREESKEAAAQEITESHQLAESLQLSLSSLGHSNKQ